jgi:hypothetical protein
MRGGGMVHGVRVFDAVRVLLFCLEVCLCEREGGHCAYPAPLPPHSPGLDCPGRVRRVAHPARYRCGCAFVGLTFLCAGAFCWPRWSVPLFAPG